MVHLSPRALLVLALLVALPLAAPVATGEHEFSHRLEVVGRAVDAAGEPVPGAPVSVTFAGSEGAPRCLVDAPQEDKTTETGDFHVCRHVHVMDAPVDVEVRIGDTIANATIDPLLRRVYVPLRIEDDWPVRSIQGERTFAAQFVVTGRIVNVLAQPTNLEGVQVRATAAGGLQVNVTVEDANGTELATEGASTNIYGDFRIELPLRELPPESRVRLVFPGDSRVASAPLDLRRADFDVERHPSARVEPPGATPGFGIVALLVALGAAAASFGRRR